MAPDTLRTVRARILRRMPAPAPRPVTAAAARRFLVLRHALAPARALSGGPDAVEALVRRLGSVQFDPLAVAGRNHDLVLHARIAGYRPEWAAELLSERRTLIELWNKGLSLVPMDEVPWHRDTWDRTRARYAQTTFPQLQPTIDAILARIDAQGPVTTGDFGRGPAIDWWWGPTGEVRAALEALTVAGILGVSRRAGNRRTFDRIERIVPAALLARAEPRDARVRHRLLSRHRAHGLLGTGGQAELWIDIAPARRTPGMAPGEPTRAEALAALLASGALVPVTVAGVRGTRYVVAEDLPLLASAEAADALPSPVTATLLAPLDPLAWDRDLLRALWGFDYVWEVYTPPARRRWGYYVLPLLWGDRLVGRVEPRIDRAAGGARIDGWWWEPGFDPGAEPGCVPAIRDALAAWMAFAGAGRLTWAAHLGRERRRFGAIRPPDA